MQFLFTGTPTAATTIATTAVPATTVPTTTIALTKLTTTNANCPGVVCQSASTLNVATCTCNCLPGTSGTLLLNSIIIDIVKLLINFVMN